MPRVPTILQLLPPLDVGDTLADAGSLRVDQPIYGSIAAGTPDHDLYAVVLQAGQTIDIRVLGVGQNPLGDSHLVVYDANGVELGGNDDAVNTDFGFASELTFVAPAAGTYYLEIRSSDLGGGGDFLLTAATADPAGTVLTVPEVAWQLTNNFWTYAYAGGGNTLPAGVHDISTGELTYDITKLTAEGAALAIQGLQMWGDILGISFRSAHPGEVASIDFDDSDPGVSAYCSSTSSGDGKTLVQSQVMVTTGWLGVAGTTLNSYSFETYVHELGHAFGLGHGGNYNGSATYADAFYKNDSQHLTVMSYMQSYGDDFDFTAFGDSTLVNDFVAARFRYVLTPMIADVYALGSIYGLSTTTRTGDTTYGYHANTGNTALDQAVTLNDAVHGNYVAFTVFDNGGTDTVDMSGFGGMQRIDLRQGASSDVLGGRLNMGIAFGTEVENATGGSGADTLTGNGLDNVLLGGAGNDLLSGLSGNDTLNGNGGTDTLNGGSGDDVLLSSGAEGWDDLYGGLGHDSATLTAVGDILANLGRGIYTQAGVFGLADHILRGVEALTFIGTGRVVASGSVGDNRLTGDAQADRLWGAAGDDTLVGNGGNDTLIGDIGNDVLDGGAGFDRLDGGAGDDTYHVDGLVDLVIETSALGGHDTILTGGSFRLSASQSIEVLRAADPLGTAALNLGGNAGTQAITGNAGANILQTGGGDDTLKGLGGADLLFSGAGHDVLEGGSGNDTYVISGDDGDLVVEAAFGGFDRLVTSVNFTLAEGVEVEYIGSRGVGVALTGNSLAQELHGDAGANLLTGNGGDDTLGGGLGNDTLIGGAGAVVMSGGSGADTFQFETVFADAADTALDFRSGIDRILIAGGSGAVRAVEALEFRINTSGLAESASDRVIYDSATGKLWFDVDGSDVSAAVQLATLFGHPTLVLADLWVAEFAIS